MATPVVAKNLRLIGLLLALAVSCQAAQAMLLSGQVEERAEGQEQNQNQSQNQTQNQTPGQNQAPLQSQSGRPDLTRPNQAALQPGSSKPSSNSTNNTNNINTFPATYQGAWYCQTTVVDSTLPAVLQGQVIGSEVVFFLSKDGGIHARWNQPGWVETQSQAITFNGTEAKADRTTYYFGDNMQGSWAARARDQFAQTGPDIISAKSYVDQYLDGQYLGRYRTTSVLKRSGSSQNMASMN